MKEKLLQLIASRPWLIAVVVLLAGAAAFTGIIKVNQTNSLCMTCHKTRGPFVSVDLNAAYHNPYKNHSESCIQCHDDKSLYVIMGRKIIKTYLGFEQVTTLKEVPSPASNFQDHECLVCHQNILNMRDSNRVDLPPRLAAIGLRFDHERHFAIKEYNTSIAKRLAGLESSSVLNEDLKRELDFLRKIRLSNCAQCHERFPRNSASADKNINFFSSNPMNCAGCHDAASGHPGRNLETPTEQTCRRCHLGRWHGRMFIFEANCAGPDTKYCTKCHPDWEPSMGFKIRDRIKITEPMQLSQGGIHGLE